MAILIREDVERIVKEAREKGKTPNLNEAHLGVIDLSVADLSGVHLSGAHLRGAILSEANLIGADLSGADLSMADLSRVHLSGAHLSRANLSGADLSGADLSGADLNEAHLRGADLSGADLNEAHFRRANLGGAILSEAHLIGANLIGADLSVAHLSGADLSGADLGGADLSVADLSVADLSGADLHGAHLIGAGLHGANLGMAKAGNVFLGNIDLSEVEGLDTVDHWGPSHIDTHTLKLSKGQIPEAFLRGCGLSDWEIENAKLYRPGLTSEEFTAIHYNVHELLVGKAIQYFSCFISYSSKDHAFAQRLHKDLQDSGVRCWFAPEDMKIGAKIRPTIDRSIRLHDKLLLILSENSIHSNWVEKEVETAFEEEDKRKQTILFPIRLDETVMETDQAWAADIRRTRHIGDFSQCGDDGTYQKGFERLLRDLRMGKE